MQRNMIKQMQKMQKKMEADLASAQKELEDAVVEGEACGGAVKVVVTGGQIVKSVKISKDAVDPEDIETLEDLIMVACNNALDKSREMSSQRMNQVTAGLSLPPGLF